MNRRTNRNQKLIDDGAVWKNEEGKWCRKCPQCKKIVCHTCFTTCSNFIEKKCDSCSRIGRPHKSDFRETLISSGAIWESNGGWYKKCSECSVIHRYASIESCIQQYKLKSICPKCAKTGKHHPLYGKHRSSETKEKLRKMFTGRKRHPLSPDHKKKISQALLNNPNRIVSHNGNNQFKRKIYRFPDGRIEKVQGYEPWTLDKLLRESVSPDDVVIKGQRRPIVNYQWSGSISRYLPDCYIVSSHTITETKSKWTWEHNLAQNIAKISGSLDAGYNVRMVIWEPGQKLFIDTTYVPKKSL